MEEEAATRLRDSSCSHSRLTGKPVGLFNFVELLFGTFLLLSLGVFFLQ
jgi:hypothetical protein